MELALEELIDFRGTASWRRRKAEQYPEDDRNLIAADLLDRLADEVPSLEGSELHQRLIDEWGKGPDPEEFAFDTGRFSDRVSETLRMVGFGYQPKSLGDFIKTLLGA